MYLPIAFHNTKSIGRYSFQHFAPLRDAPNLAEFFFAIDNLSAEVFERVLALRESDAGGFVLALSQHTTHKSRLTSSQQQDVMSYINFECQEKGKSHRTGNDANVPNQYNFDDPMIDNDPSPPSYSPNSVEDGKYLSGMSFITNNICIELRDFESRRRSGLDETER